MDISDVDFQPVARIGQLPESSKREKCAGPYLPKKRQMSDRLASDNSSRASPKPSSAVRAAVSFAASMARFAASGFKTVDEPLYQLRMSHCRSCEYRKDSQCSLCRCFIDKKAWLPHEDCPIGRWPS